MSESRFTPIDRRRFLAAVLAGSSGLSWSASTRSGAAPTDLTKGMWTDEPFTPVVESLRKEYAAFPPELVFSESIPRG